MSDYIDILLTALEDELFPSLGKDYFLPLQQANDALTALSATLTDQQRALLDSYEDASAAAGSAYQDAYARRAFLLAREVYRETASPYSAQVLLPVTATSANCPIRALSPFSRTRRLPSVREVRGYSGSSLSPSTSTRTVLPT